MSNTESEKPYSWLKTGRFTPINSLWLAENLKEVDQSVQDLLTMIEDGDYSLGDADLVHLKRSEMFDHIKKIYHKHQTLAEQYDQTLSSDNSSFGITDVHANEDIALTPPHQECQNQFDNNSLLSNISDVSSKKISTFSLSDSDSESDSVDSLEKYETPMMPYPMSNGSRSDEYATVLNKITKYKDELKATQHKLKLSEEEVSGLKIELKRNEDMASAELEVEKKRVAELQLKVEVLASQISDYNCNIFELGTDLSCSQEELVKMNDELSNARECFELEKSILETESRELSSLLLFAGERNQAMEIEADYLRNEVREAGVEKSELMRSLEEMKVKMDGLRMEVGEKCRVIESLELVLKGRVKEIRSGEMRIRELEEKVEEMRESGERLRNGVEELKKEVNEKRAEIVDRGEEKKEAIRQLCFSLDYYRNRNEKLREVLVATAAAAAAAVNTKCGYKSKSTTATSAVSAS